MPQNTTLLALPYPVPADTVDVPRDIQALADKLDTYTAIRPALVTTLPASPVDGQEIYFDAGNGVVWHFRYRASSGSAYKWESVGGSSLFAEVLPADVVSSTGFADAPTNPGPQLTVPLVGDYMFALSAALQPTSVANASVRAAPKIGAAAADSNDSILVQTPSAGVTAVQTSRAIRRTVTAAATLVKVQYMQTGGNASVLRRTLEVWPIRVA